MEKDKIINLNLSIEETNIILDILTRHEYRIVNPLINKIISQANSQIKEGESNVQKET
jgi:hypothetical protein